LQAGELLERFVGAERGDPPLGGVNVLPTFRVERDGVGEVIARDSNQTGGCT
jgi:hypothetical protein